MGGCYFLPSDYNLRLLIHLVLLVVTLKLDGRLLLFLLLCDAMINSACAMITSALRSFCRRPFFIMHVILLAVSFHA